MRAIAFPYRLDIHRYKKHWKSTDTGKFDPLTLLCNVGFGTTAMLLFGLTGKSEYCLVFYCVMASALADSLASKIGPMSFYTNIGIKDQKLWAKVQWLAADGTTAVGTATTYKMDVSGVTLKNLMPLYADETATGITATTLGAITNEAGDITVSVRLSGTVANSGVKEEDSALYYDVPNAVAGLADVKYTYAALEGVTATNVCRSISSLIFESPLCQRSPSHSIATVIFPHTATINGSIIR